MGLLPSDAQRFWRETLQVYLKCNLAKLLEKTCIGYHQERVEVPVVSTVLGER